LTHILLDICEQIGVYSDIYEQIGVWSDSFHSSPTILTVVDAVMAGVARGER
jgi:hypothetical protein